MQICFCRVVSTIRFYYFYNFPFFGDLPHDVPLGIEWELKKLPNGKIWTVEFFKPVIGKENECAAKTYYEFNIANS